MPTILHISDLHRSPEEPIDNDTLLAAILSDLDRFALVNEAPEALIVSGDLVQGVKIGAQNFEREMASQYATAFDLIGRLGDEILAGDRSKVVVVPGNHDICWNSSIAAMEAVAEDRYPKDLRRVLAEQDGRFRWSWEERRLFRVAEEVAYRTRLGAYWDAVEAFYRDVDLLLPVDRTRGFHLHRIFDGRAIVAGFESTHRNDHLRFEAGLSIGVVSRCAMQMRRLGLRPELLAAVWHHSLHGPPNREDYLNIENVREMAGLGFQIGFHGHQHLAESTDLSVAIGGGATMCIVSGGSLCAGWRELPRGTDRQYNIVRFEPALTSATLHVREMMDGNQFSGRTRGRFLDGKVSLSWTPPSAGKGPTSSAVDAKLRALTIEVEEATKGERSSTSTASLLELRPSQGTYPRLVLLRALLIDADWPAILRTFWPPEGVEETSAVAEAAFRERDLSKLETVLSSGGLPAASRETFETRRAFLKHREGK